MLRIFGDRLTLSLASCVGLCFNFVPSLETGGSQTVSGQDYPGKSGSNPAFFCPQPRLPVLP